MFLGGIIRVLITQNAQQTSISFTGCDSTLEIPEAVSPLNQACFESDHVSLIRFLNPF